MAFSISWPSQSDTHLPHKYAGWRTKLSPWSQSRPPKSKRLVTVGMKNGELQTLTMNFVTSTLTLITNAIITPSSVCQYNSKYHKIHFGSCYMALPCTVSRGLEEKHMIRSLGSTVHMSRRSMGQQFLCLVRIMTNQAPSWANKDDIISVKSTILSIQGHVFSWKQCSHVLQIMFESCYKYS